MSKTLRTLSLLGNASKGHTSKWAQHFAKIGWRVYVLSFEPAEIPGVEVVPLKGGNGRARYFLAAAKARRILRMIRPDIVHAHYATGYGLLAALAAPHPYILSVWGSDVYEYPRRSPLHAKVLRYNLKAADYLCSTSWAMAREARRYTGAPITITPFGIHCDEYRPAQNDRNGGPIVIGTVKTLEPPYGVEYLIKAFAEVTRRLPNIDSRLEIAGDGVSRGSLERLAEQEGVAHRVTFLGHIPQRDVPERLRLFDIYAALSLRESFGVAVLEASASGIPVVTTDVDGLPEVVAHGVTGYLVPPRDANAAADALILLCLDGALRKRLGTAGRTFVLERYEWNQTANIMEALYDTVSGLVRTSTLT